MSFFYQNHPERLRLYTSHNNTFATHLHRQVELILVLEGCLSVTTEQRDHTLTQSQGILIFPNRLHSLYTAESQSSNILLCLFEPGFCTSYRQYFLGSPPDRAEFDLSALSAHSRLAAQGLCALAASCTSRTPVPAYTANLAQGYLSLLFADLFTSGEDASIRPGEPKESANPELEQRIFIYLDSHFAEALSLEHVAKEFGVSKFWLSRLFSAKLKTSFPDYVSSRRLEYACQLLSTTETPVTDIALDAGFGSSRSFFREFKKAFHMTPSAYRRQYIKQAPPP